MPARSAALLIAILLAAGCQAAEKANGRAGVEGPFVWGAVPNVTHLGNLWFGGQPDPAALEAARQNGIGVVVNLREPGEMRWDEARAVEALGMQYFSAPISLRRTLSAAELERISEIVEANAEQQILIHCGNSNRAGSWLATHLVKRKGMGIDEAIAEGRRAGLTLPLLEKMTRDYLAEFKVCCASRDP
jgi:protein tyrosine phosphatase (PTP) superfamily phosphohydrolase (DUF442 family)